MAKPICVIYFPEYFPEGHGDRYWIYDYMRYLNGEKDGIENKMQPSKYWQDYYWFCFYKKDINEPEFKVFYEKDFTQVQFDELKEILLNNIKEYNEKRTCTI